MQIQKPRPNYKLVKSSFGKYEEIPEDWYITTISDFTSSHKQGFYTDQPYSNSGVRLIRISDMHNPKISYETMPFLELDDRTLKQFSVSKGDVLFARSGAAIGTFGIVDENIRAVFASYLIRFTFNPKIINNNYFGYVYSSFYVLKQQNIIRQGSSNININAENIKSIKVILPPLPEQQKITSILSNVDSLIQLAQNELEQTQRLKKGLMQKLLTNGIEHTESQKVRLFPRYSKELIPKSWKMDKLGNLLQIIDYRGRTPPFSKEGIPHLRSNNIRDGMINLEEITYVSEQTYNEYMTRGIPKENDVLFTTEGPLGEVALVPPNFKFSLAQRIMILRPKSKKINPQFLKYLLLDRKVRIRYMGLATGTTLGGIASKWFTKILLPYPEDISEQETIANTLLCVEKQIVQQQGYKSKLDNLKKGLMQKLLTGQIRVKV